MPTHLRRMAIATLVSLATLVSSVPIAYSGSPLYLASSTQSFGTFRSKAACRAKGRRLVRVGIIRGYQCWRSGKVWQLRSASDSDRNSGVYGATRIRNTRSNKFRTIRTTKRRTIRSRHRSMAACMRRGRALVRAGKISSFRCVPVK
jgi:hypothetical protein